VLEFVHARAAMAQVTLTRHLTTLFPQLPGAALSVDAATLAELVAALERMAPGIAFYICDERGRLRQHVNIFVNDEMLVDRKALGDRLDASSRVFIVQALSGG
jgi:molybdopterin synthase sulfur carrier subunit